MRVAIPWRNAIRGQCLSMKFSGEITLMENAHADGNEGYACAEQESQRQSDCDPCSRKPDDGSLLQGASWWTQQDDNDHNADKKCKTGDDFTSMQKIIHCSLPRFLALSIALASGSV